MKLSRILESYVNRIRTTELIEAMHLITRVLNDAGATLNVRWYKEACNLYQNLPGKDAEMIVHKNDLASFFGAKSFERYDEILLINCNSYRDEDDAMADIARYVIFYSTEDNSFMYDIAENKKTDIDISDVEDLAHYFKLCEDKNKTNVSYAFYLPSESKQ